jgi:hypothetical protein
VALEAWHRGQKRGYQFEDGTLRAFHEDYCHLMERISLPPEEAASRRATLVRFLGHDPEAETKRKKPRQRRKIQPLNFDFDDQIALFRELYPEGFAGDAWTKDKRGGGKALKRHRQPVVERAAELLSAEALDAQIAAGAFAEVMKSVATVLAKTDLVTASQRRLLDHKDAAGRRRFATALRDLLHGDAEPFSMRFGRFVSELGQSAGWQLATVLPALVHPGEQVAVRPTSFKVQARVLTPQLAYGKAPTPALYEGYRAMALRAHELLTEAGLAPRDLLDVHDFCWTTLRPQSLQQLEANAGDAKTEEEVAAAA